MTTDSTRSDETMEIALKPVYQDKFGLDWTKDDAGNCLQACLATVLGLDLDDVPHFVRRERHWDEMNRWLMERFGLYCVCYEDSEPWPWVQGYYLLSGKGVRGAEHVVVYKDGVLVHDPIGPSGSGLEQITHVWLFVTATPITKTREVDAEIARLREALAAANRPPLRIECPDCGDVIVISRVGETVYCQCSGSTWSIQGRKENVDA